MARHRSRSSSPPSKSKRFKADTEELECNFSSGLLLDSNIKKLHSTYVSNSPFKYAVIEKLLQDDLLKKVKDECLNELGFSEKETDIYKVNQTGDLASLSYLTQDQLALLPNLLTLRDTLYCETFRNFIRRVTGCGPLSGTKQDMSVNTYKKGCHLLNHDDVIGTRRVSYILYMPLPCDHVWQKEWGGALELYPTVEGAPEPLPIPSKSIPPSWNQFTFFEVQPGKSFHSVEEVVVDEGEIERQRLSISGWFHAAQEGEEGYEPSAEREAKSSLDQLTSTSTTFQWYSNSSDPQESLSDDQIKFLAEFLNPVYLQPKTIESLAQRFVQESSLECHSFLNASLAEQLQKGLQENDSQDGLGRNRNGRIPPHESGTDGSWRLRGPPHKWRYCTLSSEIAPGESAESQILRRLQDELFPSSAFRAWLLNVSKLFPLRYAVEARRFRPGLDYTLATSEETEARLDAILGLTPDVEVNSDTDPRGWGTEEWGGWECYMAPSDDNDDPAVYRSGSSKKIAVSNIADDVDPAGDEEMEADDDEDGTLLTVQPGFNRLLLVLRDERVMRFVKYVSAAAEGSRWDICGEYEVGMVEVEDDD